MNQSLILCFCILGMVGCRARQPEANSGILDANSVVNMSCTSDNEQTWLVGIVGWNYGVGEGLPAEIKISGDGQIFEEPAVVHYEPEQKLTVIYKSGALQTELEGNRYIGILDIEQKVLADVTCQMM